MSLLGKIFKGTKEKKDPYENAPAFKKMVEELEKEENEFVERFENVVPVIRVSPEDSEIASGGEDGHLPEKSAPLSFPLDFEKDLSIYLGVDRGEEYEWLLNRQIEVVKDRITPDKMVSKAFGNLFKQIEKKISVKILTEDIGMLENCNSLESSLVLINEIWSLARRYVKSDDLLFAIPARDVFIFGRYGDGKTTELFIKKAQEFYNDPSHPDKLNNTIYIRRKNGATEKFHQ